jgi:hypothetical protein
MHPVLRLYEDVLSSAENVVFSLPPLPRFIFVVHGSARIGDQSVNEGEAWQGEGAITVKPGKAGVTCWRWELARDARPDYRIVYYLSPGDPCSCIYYFRF